MELLDVDNSNLFVLGGVEMGGGGSDQVIGIRVQARGQIYTYFFSKVL